MANTVTKKKAAAKAGKKSPAAIVSTPKTGAASENNPSKYKPGQDADITVQSLDAIDGLRKLLTDGIKGMYWAEIQLTKALPKMAKAASSPGLVKAIVHHQQQTEAQVLRLEKLFEILGKAPQAKKCDAMEGLTKDCEAMVETTDMGTAARDIGIIMASQKVEHFEIASYKGLIQLAESIGLSTMAETLSQSLKEEQDSSDILQNIAASVYADGAKMES